MQHGTQSTSSGRALGQDKLALEHHVIKLAVEQAKGRVNEAARLAGMSWEGLAYALKHEAQRLAQEIDAGAASITEERERHQDIISSEVC